MLKKIILLLIAFAVVRANNHSPLQAQNSMVENAQQKAAEIHALASSDMIYTNEEMKALYYQNIEIIELLKEIRDNLSEQIRIEREDKGGRDEDKSPGS